MLKLVNITKLYSAGTVSVKALDGVNIDFRKNEFVSILGQSGCGKTTLLNIIGGLDRYSSGDLIIAGRSTKEYSERDWDIYRNHSIGFVFQSYNLIPHQTVLSNVELALTLSGISKTERRKRAIEALKKVGLGDQLNKKPNQLSGGQMQRVAIARALINNPEILLADEPTGALDSETSEQIMALLKDVAKDRLVIMVTHNPDLAERYSTRIINLFDGKIIGDSNPYSSETTPQPKKKTKKKKANSMTFFSALSLSFKNLLTKKGRTFLTSFAGSIGIIGIALILSLSTGFQAYIDRVQEETLSSYPILIESEQVDMSELLATMMNNNKDDQHKNDKVYANTDMYNMLNAYMNPTINSNDLRAFKAWLEETGKLEPYTSGIQYGYSTSPEIYVNSENGEILPANDYMSLFKDMYTASSKEMTQNVASTATINVFSEILEGSNGEAINDLIYSQYELVDNNMRWPENKNEVVVILDKNNEISESFLYCLGLLDRSNVSDIMLNLMSGKTESGSTQTQEETAQSWNYDDILNLKFKLLLPTDKFIGTDTDGDGTNDRWTDMSNSEQYMKLKLSTSEELSVVGIIRPKKEVTSMLLTNTAVGYTSELTDWYINRIANEEIIVYQQTHPETDILTGLPFKTSESNKIDNKALAFKDWCSTLTVAKKSEVYKLVATTPNEETLQGMVAQTMAKYPDRASKEALLVSAYSEAGIDKEAIHKLLADTNDEELDKMVVGAVTEFSKKAYSDNILKQIGNSSDLMLASLLDKVINEKDDTELIRLYDLPDSMRYSDSNLEENLDNFGFADLNNPYTISLYAKTFENKDKIASVIDEYNASVKEDKNISYTDYVAIMMSSISTIIDVISYVLMAFVSISLIVSSIMIGIITYISVLERTKEIGILRSIGASKRDISRVFNAETLIVGFVSGLFGILVTVLLNIPISIIINYIADIPNVASLPVVGAIVLICISMLLTLIAGLIPSRLAAKKDPVVALRTE